MLQTPIVISEEQFHLLAMSDVGPRIRIIRELLYSHFGDRFTSKNVALRIGIISPPALSAIERGETKDCPSKVLRAISRDFRVDMDIFFDDFYVDGYKTILIGSEIEKEPHLEEFTIKPNGSSPLHEKEYTCIINVAIEASNGDRRPMYQRRTHVKLNHDQYTVLTADIENSITNLETLISPELIPSSASRSPLEKAMSQIELRDIDPSLIGWVPKAAYDRLMVRMHEIAEKYTLHLIAGDGLSGEETNSLFNHQAEAIDETVSVTRRRRKPAKMPSLNEEGE